MVGQVPSPTPMVGTSGDSTRVTRRPPWSSVRKLDAKTAAVSQPADPPPTITTCLMVVFTVSVPKY
jgi:hypothetical protein